MPLQLPKPPIRDEEIEATWGRQIVEYLRQITPRSSSSILVTRTGNGWTPKLVSSPRPSGGSGTSRPDVKSLTFEPDPDFDAESPTIRFRGGNFAGEPVATEVISVEASKEYRWGKVEFDYAGKILAVSLVTDTEASKANVHPTYENPDTGEAWYLFGSFSREVIDGSSPTAYTVKYTNDHPGGNVLWEYGCDGNIRWGVTP